MTVGLSLAARNSQMDDIRQRIDSGGAGGKIKICGGTRPNPTGSTTPIPLAIMTFAWPSAPAASAGVLTFNSITSETNAPAAGTATWARIESSTGTFVADVSVSTSGSDINLSSTTIAQGGTVSCTSATLTNGSP